MARVTLSFLVASGVIAALSACGGGGSSTPPPVNPTAPTVTVTPSAANVTTVQAFSVLVAVTGSGSTPTGSVTLKSGSYTSAATTLAGGSATIQIAAAALGAGTDSLTASYTPDSASTSTYTSASGSGSVTVTKVTPTVTVTPAEGSFTPAQAVSVLVSVSGGSGAPPVTGVVTLTSGAYSSTPAALVSGSATINVAAGALATGSDTLTATFTPDTAGAAIYNGASGTGAVTVATIAPAVTVTPSAANITTQQDLTVTVAVNGGSGNPAATGTVTLTSGKFTSSAATLASGGASIDVPPASLVAGNDTLTVTYTPDTASENEYSSATGTGSVTVAKITPTVTVTPASMSATTVQDLEVTVAVAAATGDATPTGTVILTSGTYSSAATALASGSATIDIPAFALAAGSDTLTGAYTPDSTSTGIYNTANGTSAAVTVTLVSLVSVNQGVSGPAVSDQLLGMNMATWGDPTTPGIVAAFQAAGIKSIRWPGGGWSDVYHWKDNSGCGINPNSNATYLNFINDLEIPAGLDVALTADYGTNATCNGPGDPTEAAAWVQFAEANGGTVSHVTVGNEEYGTWEEDLHTIKNDPTTYANATATGYYPDIKAVDKNVLVGVSVNPGNQPAWDPIVLAQAKYDFVEYHFYPQSPGKESDTYLVQQAAQDLTTEIDTIESELKTAGNPNTPIYVGEVGSVYTDPGKQSWSITQGLYAGQVLGEMMNDGVERLTWWIGFDNCFGAGDNNSASLYGWQNWGAYNVFSDGPADSGCPDAGPLGTMSPTARAFQLFSNVAVNGESAMPPPAVKGDGTDVRAYAATHSGGTALVLFNLNETTSEPVQIALSAEKSSPGVTVITYSKAIYDDSQNDKWDPPTTTNMGAQNLPLTLTLDPWSMNVVIVQ